MQRYVAKKALAERQLQGMPRSAAGRFFETYRCIAKCCKTFRSAPAMQRTPYEANWVFSKMQIKNLIKISIFIEFFYTSSNFDIGVGLLFSHLKSLFGWRPIIFFAISLLLDSNGFCNIFNVRFYQISYFQMISITNY